MLAAQGVKGTMDVETLPATPETLQEMATGSPRTPGFDEHTGRTMKPAPQWPQAREPEPSQAPERDREPDNDIDR